MYESTNAWDTNINSVGGTKDMLFVTSPYSNNVSANAAQGALTYGNLVTEFDPPDIQVTPIDDGYFVNNRIDMTRNNPVFKDNSILSSTQVSRPKDKERYTEMKAFRGSNIHMEQFGAKERNIILIIILCIMLFVVVMLYFKVEKQNGLTGASLYYS